MRRSRGGKSILGISIVAPRRGRSQNKYQIIGRSSKPHRRDTYVPKQHFPIRMVTVQPLLAHGTVRIHPQQVAASPIHTARIELFVLLCARLHLFSYSMMSPLRTACFDIMSGFTPTVDRGAVPPKLCSSSVGLPLAADGCRLRLPARETLLFACFHPRSSWWRWFDRRTLTLGLHHAFLSRLVASRCFDQTSFNPLLIVPQRLRIKTRRRR